MKKVFKVAAIHHLLKLVSADKITYSRMVEIMNEMAFTAYAENDTSPIKGPVISIPDRESRCCGRCDGINDLCFADMVCDEHKTTGCELCYGPIFRP